MRLTSIHIILFVLTITCAINTAYAENAVVLNSRDASLTLINTDTQTTKLIKGIGKEPHHLYPSPDGKELWVANAASDDIIKIDPITGETIQRVKNISDPYQLIFTKNGLFFIAVNLRLNRVDIYSHHTLNKDKDIKNNVTHEFKLIKRIPTGALPSHVYFSPDETMAYITLQGDDQLIAIDMKTLSIAWKTPVGKTPAGVWVTPQGMILVGIMGEDYVQIIDPKTHQTVKKLITGKGAHAFRGKGDGKIVFVSNRDNNTISAIDMETLTKLYDIPTNSGPDCMDVSSDGKTLWVTNRWAKTVSMIDIDSKKTLKQYPVGLSPHGVYIINRAEFK